MNTPFPFALYRAATALIEPAARPFLGRRLRDGKEDAARLEERLGRAGLPRPHGALAWVHGASVGEALAVLPLIERLVQRGFAVLLTTGTVTSAEVLADRLPRGAMHQFVPLDLPGAVDRFLDHWRPDLACFTESELWPNLLGGLRRRSIPAALVNARLSARSFRRWRRAPFVIGPLLGTFRLILAQSDGDAARLRALGCTVAVTGNVKFDGPPPPADPADVERLKAMIGARPIWIAASTHAGEEALCLAVHRRLMADHPDLLTVIVPRKAHRGAELAGMARDLGLTVSRRAAGEPIEAATSVHIADTMGDMGLFYRLGPLVFVGKSLVEGGGGQNPIEPAKLGCLVLHGPHVANFEDAYRALDEGGGGIPVQDEDSLAAALETLLSHQTLVTGNGARSRETVAALAGATDRTMGALEPLIAPILAGEPQ